MSKTAIEWTATVAPDGTVTKGETWNPVTGCTTASAGCTNCYARALHTIRHDANLRAVLPYTAGGSMAGRFKVARAHGSGVPDLPFPASYDAPFATVQTHDDRLYEPLGWQRPRRCFTCSMADLFHDDVPNAFLDKVFAVMRLAPHIDFLVLTKRTERMAAYFEHPEQAQRVAEMAHLTARRVTRRRTLDADGLDYRAPAPNIWLGTSVENRGTKHRLDTLRTIPAAFRFVSFEPLIGPVGMVDLRDIHWAIIGGETGQPGQDVRSMDIAWVRSLIYQARRQGAAVFVKQMGEKPFYTCEDCGTPGHGREHTFGFRDRRFGRDMAEWPEDIRIREWPVAS